MRSIFLRKLTEGYARTVPVTSQVNDSINNVLRKDKFETNTSLLQQFKKNCTGFELQLKNSN